MELAVLLRQGMPAMVETAVPALQVKPEATRYQESLRRRALGAVVVVKVGPAV